MRNLPASVRLRLAVTVGTLAGIKAVPNRRLPPFREMGSSLLMSDDQYQSTIVVTRAAAILMARFDVNHRAALRLLMTIAARSDMTVDALARRVIASGAHKIAAAA
jgi:hypothetical protein